MDDAPAGVLFEVLGPFEVLVDGAAVALGGTRQRLVLAALVANANAVVSADRLIEVVWGDEPPASAWSTLQKYVYRLRGSLGDRILTRAPGYVLRVEGGASDASQFESLLADATRLTTAGELSEAISTFDTALGLWRGPAWAEFVEFDFAHAEVARLEGLRASAIEDRTEVALAAGHHAEVIGELEGTVARHPLRERPRAQLMLALYRAGRHADALRAYEAFRRYLGEEVGLEPSASLAQLADKIVLQKPELDWVPPPRAGGRAALPSGTVTFLFSDIEGSTRLFRQVGHGYVELLERHRRLVRAAVAAAGGVEVNSEGDGLFFAFSGAPAALAASVAAQRALVEEDWPEGAIVRVRMGLHTGEATPRDGDYIAIAVHQAARVKDAAHGGQVLLSGATVVAIGEVLPGDCSVRGLGAFALKAFEHGVELFEARHPSLPEVFPTPRVDVPARPASALPGALAADAEPLVGRAAELAWLDVLWQRAVAGDRVTAFLHGPPGIGKSRLLAEFARRAHAGGASVTHHVGLLSSLDVERGGRDTVLAVLDDLDGSAIEGLAPGVTGAFLLGACRHPVAGTANTRQLGGLSLDEVGVLLAQKIEAVTADLAGAVHTETQGNPGLVHDVARRLRDREAEQRVQRALERVGSATREARLLRDEIAGGVLERERIAAHAPDGAVVGVCPYKGLARYEAADAPFFHGRERLVATLVARLAVDRFVGIIGASGSGKSSLVRAGLLPTLAAGALPGSDAWPTCTYTPGEHPLRQFAEALAPLAGVPAPELARRLDRQPDEVGAVLDTIVRGRPGTRVIVVVDQFEEIATLCRDSEERERFAGVLVDIVTDPDIPAVLVPVVRADYYGTLGGHPELARLFEQSQLLVGAMSDAELRRAITEPARRARLVLEDTLADAVCADAGSEPGALPLVSTALVETWVRRDGVTLTLAGYREAGGVQGSLARLADDVYGRLDDGGRGLARRLFLRLAEPGEGTDDVRRRMPRAEFGSGDEADAVLDTFVGRRLLIADAGSVEVAHEALLREWPRLRAWLEEDRAGRRLHRQLTLSAASWDGEGRDAGALYRGTRLDAALEWAGTHTEDVNAVEREFLDASADAQHDELRKAHRTARRLRRLTAGVALVAVLALLAGGVALVQRENANHQAASARRAASAAIAARQAADAARLTSDVGRLAAQARSFTSTHLDRALLLAIEAHRLSSSATTDGALEAVLTKVGPGLDRIVNITFTGECPFISPDGRWIAAGDSAGIVHLVDLTHPEQPARTLPGGLGPAGCPFAFFNARSTHVLGAGSNGQVIVWDTMTGRAVGAPIPSGPFFAFAQELPSGQVATGNITGKVIIWDTSDPTHPSPVGPPIALPPIPANGPAGVEFAGPGRLAVTNGGGTTEVYKIGSQAQLYAPLPGNLLASSPSGRTLALFKGTLVTLWDSASGVELGALPGAIVPAWFGAFFSHDGSEVMLTDAATNSVRVFSVATRAEISVPVPIDVNGGGMGLLDDGRLAVYSGQTVTLRRVGATEPAPFAKVMSGPRGAWGLELSFEPGGTRVDGAQITGVTGTWDAASGKQLAAGALPPGLLVPPALSPDGATLYDTRADGTVEMWDPARRVLRGTIATRAVQPVAAWSRTAPVLVTVGAGGGFAIWDVHEPSHAALLARGTAPAYGANRPVLWMSPDGRSFTLGCCFNPNFVNPTDIPVFSVPSGRLLHLLHLSVGWEGITMSFSPDSQTLATSVLYNTSSLSGTLTGAVVLWDVASGQRKATLTLPYLPIGVAWTSNGTRLATAPFAPHVPDYTNVAGRIDFWDASTLLPVGDPLHAPGDAVLGESLGYLLLSGSTTPVGEPIVWDLDPAHWDATACALAGRNLTQAEWQQYLPGRPYQATCSQWPPGPPQ